MGECDCGRPGVVAIMVPWTDRDGNTGRDAQPFCRRCDKGLAEEPQANGDWTRVVLALVD